MSLRRTFGFVPTRRYPFVLKLHSGSSTLWIFLKITNIIKYLQSLSFCSTFRALTSSHGYYFKLELSFRLWRSAGEHNTLPQYPKTNNTRTKSRCSTADKLLHNTSKSPSVSVKNSLHCRSAKGISDAGKDT